MGTWAKDELEQLELVTRILRDSVPTETADAVCVFGETVENEGSMLDRAAHLCLVGIAKRIAVTSFGGCKNGNFENRSGAEYIKTLLGMGVNKNFIVSFPLSDRLPPCTDAEAIGLVGFATKLGWQSLFVPVPPIHAVRAYVSVVSAVIKANSNIKVWSLPGYPLSYAEEVFHSQTAPRARRREQFGGELGKLIRYMEKGDHVPPARIIEYMNWRDDT